MRTLSPFACVILLLFIVLNCAALRVNRCSRGGEMSNTRSPRSHSDLHSQRDVPSTYQQTAVKSAQLGITVAATFLSLSLNLQLANAAEKSSDDKAFQLCLSKCLYRDTKVCTALLPVPPSCLPAGLRSLFDDLHRSPI